MPHVGVSYLPHSADWDYITPLALDDDQLDDSTTGSADKGQLGTERQTPCIAGFVALIQVFLCCVEFYSHGLPGSIAQSYNSATVPQDSGLRRATSPEASSPGLGRHHQRLDMVHRMFRTLNRVIEALPKELGLPTATSDDGPPKMDGRSASQFGIMRANIHITSLYLQSNILETFQSSLRADASQSDDEDTRVSSQIFRFRQSIARELLNIIEYCPLETLEPNGASMVIKIREIASSLLEHDNAEDGGGDLNGADVKRFIDILTGLDWGARTGEPAALPRETD